MPSFAELLQQADASNPLGGLVASTTTDLQMPKPKGVLEGDLGALFSHPEFTAGSSVKKQELFDKWLAVGPTRMAQEDFTEAKDRRAWESKLRVTARTEFAKQFAAPTRTWGEAFGDYAGAAAGGIASGVQGLSDLAGADDTVSQTMRGINEGINLTKSAKRKDQELQNKEQAAALGPDAGFLDKALLSAKQTITDPYAMVNFAGQLVPNVAAGVLTGGAGYVPTAIGALQGAGAVKGQIYDTFMQTPEADLKGDARYMQLRASGLSEKAAKERRAAELQSYTEAPGSIALGAGVGAVVGRIGPAEQALNKIGAVEYRAALAETAKNTALPQVLKAAGKEAATEAPQEGLEQYLGNTGAAAGGAAINPMSGVAESVGQAAVLAPLAGGALHYTSGVQAQNQLDATPTATENVDAQAINTPATAVTPAVDPERQAALSRTAETMAQVAAARQGITDKLSTEAATHLDDLVSAVVPQASNDPTVAYAIFENAFNAWSQEHPELAKHVTEDMYNAAAVQAGDLAENYQSLTNDLALHDPQLHAELTTPVMEATNANPQSQPNPGQDTGGSVVGSPAADAATLDGTAQPNGLEVGADGSQQNPAAATDGVTRPGAPQPNAPSPAAGVQTDGLGAANAQQQPTGGRDAAGGARADSGQRVSNQPSQSGDLGAEQQAGAGTPAGAVVTSRLESKKTRAKKDTSKVVRVQDSTAMPSELSIAADGTAGAPGWARVIAAEDARVGKNMRYDAVGNPVDGSRGAPNKRERDRARAAWDDSYGIDDLNNEVKFTDMSEVLQEDWLDAHRSPSYSNADLVKRADEIIKTHLREGRVERANAKAAENARASALTGSLTSPNVDAQDRVGSDARFANKDSNSDKLTGQTTTGASNAANISTTNSTVGAVDGTSTAPSAQAARDIQALTDSVRKDIIRRGGEPGDDTVHPFRWVSLPLHGPLSQIAGAFGKRIVGFEVLGTPAVLKDFGFFEGVTRVVDNDTIFINKNTDRPHLAILGHELAHTLRVDDPKLYSEFVIVIKQFVNSEAYNNEFVQSSIAKEAGSPELQQEEFMGEILADGFLNRGFWNALGAANPTLLQRVMSAVRELLFKAVNALGSGRKTEQYLTDFDEVMQIAGEVMAEYKGKSSAPSTYLLPAFARKPNSTNPDLNSTDYFSPFRSQLKHGSPSIGSRMTEMFVSNYEAVARGLDLDLNAHPAMQALEGATLRAAATMQPTLNKFKAWTHEVTTLAKSMKVDPSTVQQHVGQYTTAMYVASGANIEQAQRYNTRIAEITQMELDRLADPDTDPQSPMPAAWAEELGAKTEWVQKFNDFDSTEFKSQADLQESGYRPIGGLTTATATKLTTAIENDYGSHVKQLGDLHQKLLDVHTFMRDDLVTRGVYSQAQKDGWTDNPFFVPTTGTPDMLDGSTDSLGSHISDQGHHKGRQGRSTVADSADRAILERAHAGYTEVGYRPFKEELAKLASVPASGVRLINPRNLPKDPGRTVSYRHENKNGDMVNEVFIFEDPRVGEAIYNGNVAWASPVTSIFGASLRFTSWMVTQGTAVFPVLSTFRDVGERMVNISLTADVTDSNGKKVELAALGSMLRAYGKFAGTQLGGELQRAAFEFAFKGTYANTPAGQALQELSENGGVTNWANSVGRTYQDNLKAINAMSGMSRVPHDVRESLAKWSEAWEVQSSTIAYMMLREQDVPPAQAAAHVRNAMNFRRKGTITPGLRPLFMFFNPAVQGAYGNIRSLVKDGKVNVKGMAYLATSVAISAALQALASETGAPDQDDPLLGPKGSRTGSLEASRSLVLYAGDQPIKIPVPYGITNLGWNIARISREMSAGKVSNWEAAGEMLQLFSRELTGAPISEVSSAQSLPMKFLRTITPQPLQGVLSAASGTNAFGTPLNTFLRPDTMKSEQKKASTPEVWRTAAKALRELPLGPDMTPEELQVLTGTVLVGPLQEITQALTKDDYQGSVLGAAVGMNRVLGKTPKALEVEYYRQGAQARATLQQLNSATADQLKINRGEKSGKGDRDGHETSDEFEARLASSGLSVKDQLLVQEWRASEKVRKSMRDDPVGQADVMREFLTKVKQP